MTRWQPAATVERLHWRAASLARLRQFLSARGVVEIDVPALAPATVTDPHLESFMVASPVDPAARYYLVTSPEFYLKRLLAAGSGPVFSLAHAFRAEPVGSRHSPEFLMLEWYRPGWGLRELMDEVLALVSLFVSGDVRHLTYREAFAGATGIDPHRASLAELKAVAHARLSPAFDSDDRDTWLDLLFSHLVEPTLQGLVFVTAFPASQAALARVQQDAQGDPVAARFELYVNGVELANGYDEECDAGRLEERFTACQALRRQRGQVVPAIDRDFLQAMQAGLPPCCGVALGVDRLLMLACGARTIAEVMPFRLEGDPSHAPEKPEGFGHR